MNAHSSPTSNLSTTVVIYWTTHQGYERDCEVEVDYLYDGDEAQILSSTIIGSCGIADTDSFDEQLYEAVEAVAPEQYAEWLADYGEYLRDCREDARAAGSYVPGNAVMGIR